MVGVLALQGAVSEHIACLKELGVDALEVKTPEALQQCQGLIIPGGESTAVGKLLARDGLGELLQCRIKDGMPVYGTCTGLILLGARIEQGMPDQFHLSCIDMHVVRNGYGRQVDSFEAPLEVPVLGAEPFPGVFIRAPYVESVGPGVEVLCRHGERIVAVRQGSALATAFHPELTSDLRMHRYFVSMVEAASHPQPREAERGSGARRH